MFSRQHTWSQNWEWYACTPTICCPSSCSRVLQYLLGYMHDCAPTDYGFGPISTMWRFLASFPSQSDKALGKANRAAVFDISKVMAITVITANVESSIRWQYLLGACRAPQQQANYPMTDSRAAAAASRGLPDQASLGTAGKTHQPLPSQPPGGTRAPPGGTRAPPGGTRAPPGLRPAANDTEAGQLQATTASCSSTAGTAV